MDEGMMALLWYLIIGVSVVFYVVLDGFDLGVGLLHLFAKKDEDRRIFLNAIGPVWDGNEVWLIIVGGALFAGFPNVYATLFSGFYNLCMLFLCGLIFRAVAIEFRSKHPAAAWRSLWDRVFAVASIIIAFGLGLILGNLIEGLPLNAEGDFTGTLTAPFHPYSLLMGFFTCSLLLMHGAIFLTMKTEGKLHDQLRTWTQRAIFLFFAFYLLVSTITWTHFPYMTERLRAQPLWWLVALAPVVFLLNVLREFRKKRDGWAFSSSCFAIVSLFLLFGMGTFPNLVRASSNPEQLSLTYHNSAASPLTLKVLLIIVLIGVPLVLAYGFIVYRIFRGKVKIGPTSY